MQGMHHSLPIGCLLFEAEGDFPENINSLAKAGVHISRNVLKDHLSTRVPRKPVFQGQESLYHQFSDQIPVSAEWSGSYVVQGLG